MTPRLSHRTVVLPHMIKFLPKLPVAGELPRVYGFDLDHTLIKPKSGGRFGRSADDWMFMSYALKSDRSSEKDASKVRRSADTLVDILSVDANAHVVVFSNQGGVITVPRDSKSCVKYMNKIETILKDPSLEKVRDRIWLYASPKRPASLSNKKTKPGKITKAARTLPEKKPVADTTYPFETMRKPNIGMYEEFKKDFPGEFEFVYYCGDAAGRASDFSDSDKMFAQNVGSEFRTPEEVFI
ncbi:polynucleotide 3'-phosphatase [Lachancea thermotolerans CBS 6340]|uniref:KLTH0F10208p n=1 Tax=Lachancea thermotolerans (strain ATCC 56472 / CBS 6340 / NRRL Y-8284) TaxID=559295 RepID=C5DL58_LACTC|nr:KLTH0F10208p [Lachancea thermotolerans CBS 6340]CAR24209.1 KLTH0F10208p [Lachancea thermotolerans CBS 6340]